MNYEVFIDASFWVALIYKRDQNYGDAREHWERVNRSGRRIVTTNWTLYEALTILNGRHARHDLVLELLDLVHRTNTFVADASAFEQDALTIFTTHTDKRWSVVDCANFACIRQRSTLFALSYDERDFGQAQTEFGFTSIHA